MDHTEQIMQRLRDNRAHVRWLKACRLEVPAALLASIEHDEALLNMPQHGHVAEDTPPPVDLLTLGCALAFVAGVIGFVGWVL